MITHDMRDRQVSLSPATRLALKNVSDAIFFVVPSLSLLCHLLLRVTQIKKRRCDIGKNEGFPQWIEKLWQQGRYEHCHGESSNPHLTDLSCVKDAKRCLHAALVPLFPTPTTPSSDSEAKV